MSQQRIVESVELEKTKSPMLMSRLTRSSCPVKTAKQTHVAMWHVLVKHTDRQTSNVHISNILLKQTDTRCHVPCTCRADRQTERQTDTRCHVPLAHGLVDAAADNEDLLNDDAGDVVGVAGQDADAVAARSLGCPQSDRIVVGSSGQDRSILAHRHAVDSSWMIVQHVKVISSFTVFENVTFKILGFWFICSHL